jgi:hypothetical protein
VTFSINAFIKTVDVEDGSLLFFSFGMDLSKRRVTGIWIF